MESFKISDLDISLKHRQYFSRFWIWIFRIIVILCAVIIIVSNLSLLIDYIKCKHIDSNDLIGTVGSTIGLMICLILFLLFLRYGKIIEKEKAKCLEDGVKLNAISTQVNTYIPLTAPFVCHRRILVSFYYMNKKHEIQSNVWSNKYVNRQIEILYSPKYDLAFILKDKENAIVKK